MSLKESLLHRNRLSITLVVLAVVALSVGVAGGAAATADAEPGTDGDALGFVSLDERPTVESSDSSALTDVDRSGTPIEDEYVEDVPDEDDPYYEATASDGSWISYVNPRDEYRSPYLGHGSGKICVTLLNEDGEVVVGESVPDTTVSVPTGDELEWHTSADPFTVEYPLTDHYDRPLDADQFGTNPDLPQGDGYLDSHCLEWHGLPEDETVEYGEAEVEGEHAEWIEVVGYIQQGNQAWESDVDPLEDAVSYEEAGGGWTYETEESHGQLVVVLQLDPPEDGDEGESEDDADSDGADGDDSLDGSDGEDGTNETVAGSGNGDDDSSDDADDELPGFGVLVALVALSVALFVRARH